MEIIKSSLQFNSNMTKMGTVEGILLHNSGVSVLQSIEVIHNYHKNHNGWAGIGYQYYVRKDGTIYEGRSEKYAGAHCPGANSISIGICAEGNFNEETMSEIQKQAIIELIADIKLRYNIKWIKGHREILNTSCPGANFPLEEIINATVEKNETAQIKKSIDEIAQEVINNKWDVQPRRKQLLEQSGYNYNEVQAKVNEILLGNKTTVTRKSNEQIANEVIEGKWGNNPSRKEKLQNAGYDYNAIQKIVNKKLR